MMVINKYWCYLSTCQGHHCLYLFFSASANFSFVLHIIIIEAHPNKFTVGMLETPLRVGVPFQVNQYNNSLAARAKMSLRRAQNIFVPKNINSITINITLESIEKIKTEKKKMTTKHSEE